MGQVKAGGITPSLASSLGCLLPPVLRKEHGDEANDGVILMHNKHCALLHGGCCGRVYEKAFGGQHWKSHFSPPSITGHMKCFPHLKYW